MQKFVAYYRVSTQRQGDSGLGLDAQRATVENYIERCKGERVAEFTETESGKKDERIQLAAAIAEAKRLDATLIIAKLDRLSRNVSFIFALKDAKIDFVCCDNPNMNTLTLGIMATFAQHERETISKRTKDALAAAKARGTELGNAANFTDAGRKLGAEVRSKAAREGNAQAAHMVRLAINSNSKLSLRKLAEMLNNNSYRTRTGGKFSAMAVKRLLSAASGEVKTGA